MKAYRIGSLALLGTIVFGLLLALSPTTAMGLFIASTVAYLIDRIIALSVFLLNRLSRHCRESLSRGADRSEQSTDSEQRSVELAETLARLQRRERELSIAYTIRRCSEAEVAVASSLRLQAEISLLRHNFMPKPFSEAIKAEC